MKNVVNTGHTLAVARASASVGGIPYDLGSGLVGVAVNSSNANVSTSFETSGVKRFTSEGSAFVIGESVGWDNALNQVVKTGDVAKDFDLGIVVAPSAGGGDNEVEVMINGARGTRD